MSEEMKNRQSQIRRAGIEGRDSLTKEQRQQYSERIVEQILESSEFQNARTIMIYKAVRGEVRLEALETAVSDATRLEEKTLGIADDMAGKRLAYPRCISGTEMIALVPLSDDAWKRGSFGIPEPVPEQSEQVAPEDIDLIICPCSAFDEACNRMGMGAGYYDRFLEKCVNARIVSVAFEVQKADDIPVAPWDYPMEKVFTEANVYVVE